MYIFRAWITTKDGARIYARDYGKRAFKIWVDKKLSGRDACIKNRAYLPVVCSFLHERRKHYGFN